MLLCMLPHPGFIGPYRIVEIIGHGGMGVVYRGENQLSGASAAVKTVRAAGEGTLQSLRREIHALARIRHPGIVRIVDEGIHDGLPWYAMELLEGLTLRHWAAHEAAGAPAESQAPTFGPGAALHTPATEMASGGSHLASSLMTLPAPGPPEPPAGKPQAERRAPRPPACGGALGSILTLVRRLCAPLAYLHGEGLVHRDLKPDNVLVRPDGWPVLVDFGLMSTVGGRVSRDVLETGAEAAGTLAYMAPEQILGELVDARADLYALGCILYELVCGRLPFLGTSRAELSFGHLQGVPARPSTLVDAVPPALDALILQLLAKRPHERLGYAKDVAAALAALGAAEEPAPGPRPRDHLYRPRLAGRDAEVRWLLRLVARLGQGESGLVLIGGESGVGKTRLAVELGREARMRGVRVLTGHSGGAGPLNAFREVLQTVADRCRELGRPEAERLLGRRGPLLAPYEPVLASVPGLAAQPSPAELPPDSARLRLFGALADTLEALAGDRPLLLVLDDLQWARDLTLGFLRFWALRHERPRRQCSARSSPASGVLLAGLYRSEEAGGPLQGVLETAGVRRRELQRLDERAVGRLVGDMLALPLPPEGFVRFLTRHSEGNPFFIAEYLRTAVAEGVLYRDESGRWRLLEEPPDGAALEAYERLPLPGSVRELVARRLERLSPAAAHLAQAAAILGRDVDEVLLAMMARLGGAGAMEAIEELLARQILEELEIGHLRFVHAKIRDVAYESIEPVERRELHRAAAEAMEAQPERQLERYLSGLGDHWERAGRPDEARRCHLAAARQAVERHGHQEAERHYRAYLALAQAPGAETRRVRLELARDVLEVQGRNGAALQEHALVLAEARAAGDRPTEGLALLRIGGIHWATGSSEAAREAFAAALELARSSGDRRIEGRALSDLAVSQHVQGQLEEARALYEQSLGIVREEGDLRQEAITLGNLGIVQDDLGDARLARAMHEQALHLARQLGDRRLEGTRLSSLGQLEQVEKRLDEARSLYTRSLAILREVGDRRQEGLLLGYLASVAVEQGLLDEAGSLFDQARQISLEVGDRRTHAIFTAEMANLERYRGQLVLAERLARETERVHRELGDGLYTASALCARGHLALARGRPARELLAEARALVGAAQAGPQSELGRAVARLERAVTAFEAGQPLVRGESPADLPAGLLAALARAGPG
jgi:eukaryotic-like serine/threonine-protein kinase